MSRSSRIPYFLLLAMTACLCLVTCKEEKDKKKKKKRKERQKQKKVNPAVHVYRKDRPLPPTPSSVGKPESNQPDKKQSNKKNGGETGDHRRAGPAPAGLEGRQIKSGEYKKEGPLQIHLNTTIPQEHLEDDQTESSISRGGSYEVDLEHVKVYQIGDGVEKVIDYDPPPSFGRSEFFTGIKINHKPKHRNKRKENKNDKKKSPRPPTRPPKSPAPNKNGDGKPAKVAKIEKRVKTPAAAPSSKPKTPVPARSIEMTAEDEQELPSKKDKDTSIAPKTATPNAQKTTTSNAAKTTTKESQMKSDWTAEATQDDELLEAAEPKARTITTDSKNKPPATKGKGPVEETCEEKSEES